METELKLHTDDSDESAKELREKLSFLLKDPDVRVSKDPVTGRVCVTYKVLRPVNLDEANSIPDIYRSSGCNELGLAPGGARSTHTAGVKTDEHNL